MIDERTEVANASGSPDFAQRVLPPSMAARKASTKKPALMMSGSCF